MALIQRGFMTEELRPFFVLFGSKWRVAKGFALPQYDTIVEPFAGGAGYSLRHFGKKIILVERDPRIAAVWRYLLHVTPAEILALPDIRIGETLEDCEGVDDLDICEEARLLIGFWLNTANVTASKKPCKWMRDGSHSVTSFWGTAIRFRIASQVDHIRHWTLIEGDYTDAPQIEATWFIDPPYQKAGVSYRFGSALLDYHALGEWCVDRKGQVQVCENVGASWLPFRPWKTIRANTNRVSVEALWTND